MKNQKGYTIPELLVVMVVVGIIAIVCIVKVSFAFSEISNPEEQKEKTERLVELASETYAKSKEDEFKKEEDTYIFAKEVAQAGFLFERDEYNSMKVKISYDKETDTFKTEVVE